MEKLIDIAKQCRIKMKQTAMGTDDFPYLLGNTMHKKVMEGFVQIPTVWRNYALPTTVTDYRTWDRIILSQAERLLKKGEHDPVQDSYFTEKKYQVFVDAWERAITITDRMIKNNDTNSIQQFPVLLGQSGAREVPNQIHTLLAAGRTLLAYDGTAFFHANHGNKADNVLVFTEVGAGYVTAAIRAVKAQKDIANRTRIGLVPKYLVTGTTLSDIAASICGQQLVPNAGGVMVSNPAYGKLTPIEDPLLDDYSATAWYVVCDPNIIPAIEVPFLDGIQEPQTFFLNSSTQNLSTGATVPGDFVYNEIRYKVAMHFGVALAEYKAIYQGND